MHRPLYSFLFRTFALELKQNVIGKKMKIQEILSAGTPLQIVVNAAELKELFLNWQEEMVQKPQKEESPLLTPSEVTEKYRVSKVTLWRWDKMGLLAPIKMGRKSFYRQSDIERVFDLNK